MWFKNIRFYIFTKPFEADPAALEAELDNHRFRPCGKSEPFFSGWSAAFPQQDGASVHSIQGIYLLSLKREERVLPNAVVNEYLADKVSEIEVEQSRSVGRKERRDLKDEITLQLLPKAFTRSQRVYGFIAPKHDLLVIDSASPKKADDFTSSLREAIGSLPVMLPVTEMNPGQRMTQWLSGQAELPQGLDLGDECELQDRTEDNSIIKCKRHDLQAGEIQTHLEAGKDVTQLGLIWRDKISFLLGEDLSLKRLKYLDVLADDPALEDDDAAAQFDAAVNIMSQEVSVLIGEMLDWFGGLQK